MVRYMSKNVQSLKKNSGSHFFKDKSGKIVVAQLPNPPLIAFLVFRFLQMVASGTLQQMASVVAFGSLFTWAWLELFQGENYFRRLLGIVVLVGIILR